MKYEPGSSLPDPELPAHIFGQGTALCAIEDLDTDYGAAVWPVLYECIADAAPNSPEAQRLLDITRRLALSYNICRHLPIEALEKMFQASIGFDLTEEIEDAIRPKDEEDNRPVIKEIKMDTWEEVSARIFSPDPHEPPPYANDLDLPTDR